MERATHFFLLLSLLVVGCGDATRGPSSVMDDESFQAPDQGDGVRTSASHEQMSDDPSKDLDSTGVPHDSGLPRDCDLYSDAVRAANDARCDIAYAAWREKATDEYLELCLPARKSERFRCPSLHCPAYTDEQFSERVVEESERHARGCMRALPYSVYGLFFEEGNITPPFLFFGWDGWKDAGEQRQGFAVLDQLPSFLTCRNELRDEDYCRMLIELADRGHSRASEVIVEVQTSRWGTCHEEDSGELRCEGWTFTVADIGALEEDYGPLDQTSGYQWVSNNAIVSDAMEMPRLSGAVTIRAIAPDGSVHTFTNTPKPAEPAFSGYKTRDRGEEWVRDEYRATYLLTHEQERMQGQELPPDDFPALPTREDPGAWELVIVGLYQGSDTHPYAHVPFHVNVFEEYPVAPFFGALGIADGRNGADVFVGSRREHRILSLEGDEIGCVFDDGGILLSPHRPASRNFFLEELRSKQESYQCAAQAWREEVCVGAWLYIAPWHFLE